MFVYFCLGGALLLTAADYWIKQLVVQYLKPVQSIPLWQGVLHLTYQQNTGAAFSIMDDSTRLLIALTSAALTLLVGYMLLTKPKSKWLCVGLSLIIAGGMGNLIDRVLLGYVVDYIDVTIIKFAVFNFADMCAVCGTIMIVFHLVFVDLIRQKREAKALASELPADSSEAPAVDSVVDPTAVPSGDSTVDPSVGAAVEEPENPSDDVSPSKDGSVEP